MASPYESVTAVGSSTLTALLLLLLLLLPTRLSTQATTIVAVSPHHVADQMKNVTRYPTAIDVFKNHDGTQHPRTLRARGWPGAEAGLVLLRTQVGWLTVGFCALDRRSSSSGQESRDEDRACASHAAGDEGLETAPLSTRRFLRVCALPLLRLQLASRRQ